MNDIVTGKEAGFIPMSDLPPAKQIAWANYHQYLQAGGDPVSLLDPRHPEHVPLIRERDVVETPNIDTRQPPKRMEDSETHRGLSKAESGKEAAIIGGAATVITASLPLARELTGFLKTVDMQTVLTAGAVFGMVLLGVGGWRWWRGKIIAFEGRLNGTQPKV